MKLTTEDELEKLETRGPDSIFLNFAIFTISVAISFSITLLTTEIDSQNMYITFLVVSIIGYLSGVVLLILWWRSRRSVSKLIKKIKERIQRRGIKDIDLIEAAKNGNYERIAELLAAGADVNAKSLCGWTAGHHAARYGHTDCLKLLIEKGLDVNAKNEYGWTAGHWAAEYGHTDCLKLLIESGLDVNAKNNDGRTAGHFAARNRCADCLRILVQSGLEVNAKNKYGQTAGHWAAEYGHTDCLKLLIEKGLDVNAKDKNGETAGHYTAQYGHTDCLKLLEEAKKKQGEKNGEQHKKG